MSFKDINTKTSSVLIPFNGDLSIKIGTEIDCLTNIKQISFKQSQINTALALTLNHFTDRNDEIISTFFSLTGVFVYRLIFMFVTWLTIYHLTKKSRSK